MNEKEKILDNFKYWVDTNTEKGVCSIPDYICKNILNLIQKQDTEINKLNNVIDRTTKYIEELTGSCPYDTFDYQVRDCDNECKDQMAECWKEYFMKEDK